MTVKGGTTPACAACKYQRRKCIPSCPLAPYFPANQSKLFRNVHRLFGVSNVTKTLRSLESEDQRDDAMKSIIYEAEMRDRFPVYGCSVIICQLRFQLQQAMSELSAVSSQLMAYKDHASNNQMDPYNWPAGGICSSIDVPQLSGNEMVSFADNQFFLNENHDFCLESIENMTRPLMGLNIYPDLVSGNNFAPFHAQTDEFDYKQEREVADQNYQGLQFDDRQSYIETKDACESSSDSSVKDSMPCMHQVPHSELKDAAAGFSLTAYY
ncbi:LOB domain-containing protein 27-like [Dorcoceras hygrometricum]|uniref:LOB domain-containing protein 27-like n=1 Tax=Dorcoceras hygrometricum TaxID=472368 RepID=A0A2Z7CRZ6_9LAMI|nr:LOB domain-containing protein 27-like [Dorcoceras hygrometricum]